MKMMTFTTIVTIIDNSNKDNPETCDIWDTDNNSDNWEPEIMTIFVIWQLIVTLDSIRNSCDVFLMQALHVAMHHYVLTSTVRLFPDDIHHGCLFIRLVLQSVLQSVLS